MYSVEIRVGEKDLGDMLGQMREWFEKTRCSLLEFMHYGEMPGVAVVRARFATQACADLFQSVFRQGS